MGSSATSVRFEDVLHEFSTIPDVLEDVTDIILNLKQIRFLQHSPEEQKLKISKRGPGKVSAADIQINDKIEILNPEQHIATLGENGKFDVRQSDPLLSLEVIFTNENEMFSCTQRQSAAMQHCSGCQKNW